jgi:hypothetical protein
MKNLIKSIARRLLREEIETACREAETRGYLIRAAQVRSDREVAAPEAVEAWENAVEEGWRRTRRSTRSSRARHRPMIL